jgi:hypothetical protein
VIDRLARDIEAPPQDALAEAIVLRDLLDYPELIGQYDLAPLLVYPEHRQLWAAMARVHMRTPNLSMGEFYVAFLRELHASHPRQWRALSALMDDVYIDEDRWRQQQYENDPSRGTADFDMGRHHHDLAWWFQRLEDCAEARGLISAAQQIAERAWSVDLEGARRVAAFAGRPRVAPEMEIPV